MTGAFTINQHSVYALFDTGATLSFVSSQVITLCMLETHSVFPTLRVETPVGSTHFNQIAKDVKLTTGSQVLPADLLILPLEDFDIILSMDWLFRYQAEINCVSRRITLQRPNQ